MELVPVVYTYKYEFSIKCAVDKSKNTLAVSRAVRDSAAGWWSVFIKMVILCSLCVLIMYYNVNTMGILTYLYN